MFTLRIREVRENHSNGPNLITEIIRARLRNRTKIMFTARSKGLDDVTPTRPGEASSWRDTPKRRLQKSRKSNFPISIGYQHFLRCLLKRTNEIAFSTVLLFSIFRLRMNS